MNYWKAWAIIGTILFVGYLTVEHGDKFPEVNLTIPVDPDELPKQNLGMR